MLAKGGGSYPLFQSQNLTFQHFCASFLHRHMKSFIINYMLHYMHTINNNYYNFFLELFVETIVFSAHSKGIEILSVRMEIIKKFWKGRDK